MASSSEMSGFVFAVVFIVVYSALVVSVPAGLQGPNETPTTVIAIDPNLLTGFSDSANWSSNDFVTGIYDYDDLGGRDWFCFGSGSDFQIAAKIYTLVFWFGGLDYCDFISASGDDRGDTLSFENIEADADEGAVRYSLKFPDGTGAGSFVVYWNITEYATIYDAWDGNELYMLHGVGIESGATTNAGVLLIGLLFLQIPEIPVLINIILITPIWASVAFLIWFIVKEMIPFV